MALISHVKGTCSVLMRGQRNVGVLCKMLYSSTKDFPNPSIVVSRDGETIVCWHPEKPFPYEHTKPLPRTEAELKEGDSVLNIQTRVMKDIRRDGPTDAQLMDMFHTTKHVWRHVPRKRYINPNPPKDRDGI